MFLKIGDWILLKFHHDYSISAIINIIKKLTQQYAGFFKNFVKIGRLIYKLKISIFWFIHSIFSIAQFEFASNSKNNSFKQPRPDHSDFVEINAKKNAETNTRLWKFEQLFNKKFVKKNSDEIFYKMEKIWPGKWSMKKYKKITKF